ncbi:HNH endonuclease [Armatimonas sp.]|uniref:HNH endonuclease n=1 Tax=Armatimonas sp. TaxID=1872638 RepID=UPI00375194E3
MPMPKKPRMKCNRTVCANSVRRPVDIYCCKTCQHEHEYEIYISAWSAGERSGARAEVCVSKHVQRWVRRTFGEHCCQCHWAERNLNTGRIPLHLDHIDGNWRNNRPENLRLLCPNCHALTATYGAQNRGNGRPFTVQKKAVTVGLEAS